LFTRSWTDETILGSVAKMFYNIDETSAKAYLTNTHIWWNTFFVQIDESSTVLE